MIKPYSILALAGLVALFTIPMLAVCPEMEVWSNGTNYRYVIKDIHADYIDGRVSTKQQADIIWAAQQKKTEGVFVLAEDLFTYPGANKKIQNLSRQYFSGKTLKEKIANLQKNQKKDSQKARGSRELFEGSMSPLVCLTFECQKHEILHYNIECGHVQNLHVNLPQDVTQQEVVDDLEKIAAEILKHKNLFQEIGFEEDGNFRENMNELHTLAASSNRKQFLKAVATMRFDFVDERAIIMLIKWNNYKHGLICAGALHFEEIEECLKKLGYKKIKSMGNRQASELMSRSDAWELLNEKAAQENFTEILRQVLENALDLKQAFEQIFAEQRPKAPTKDALNQKSKVELAPNQNIAGLQNQVNRLNKSINQNDAAIAQLLSQGKENTAQYRELCATGEQHNQQIKTLKSQISKLQAQAKVKVQPRAAQAQQAQAGKPKPAVDDPAVSDAREQRPAAMKTQKSTHSSSITACLHNYKWPITIGIAAITAFASWFYWGK